MRFITEFECDGSAWDMTPAIVSHRKEKRQSEMGEMIANSFGWQVRGETTLIGPVKERYTLEIEAFPMDIWVEFKKLLSNALPSYDVATHTKVANAIIKLESFDGQKNINQNNLK